MTRPLNRYERRRLREMRAGARRIPSGHVRNMGRPYRIGEVDPGPVILEVERLVQKNGEQIERLGERFEIDMSHVKAVEERARRFSAEGAAAIARAVPTFDLTGARINEAVRAQLAALGYVYVMGEDGPEVFDPKPPEPAP